MPFMEASEAEWEEIAEEIEAAAAAAPDVATSTRDVYLIFLERFRDNVAAAVRAVAHAPEGGVVIHCVGGKDRTGLLAAFLLHLAGVADDEIAADYALSEERLLPRHEAWFAAADERGGARAPAPDRADAGGLDGRRLRRARAALRRRRGVPARRRRQRRASSSSPARGSVADVLAIFGPTASGKSAVAEEVARLIPAELVSADAMQVYRGLPILTNQSEARLVGYLGLDEEGSVARVPAARPCGGGRDPRRRPDAGRRRRHRALPARRPGRPRAAAAAGARRARAAGEALRRARRRRRRTSCSPSATRRPRPPCTRTTAAASCARSSSPRPARACGRARTGSGAARRGTRR